MKFLTIATERNISCLSPRNYGTKIEDHYGQIIRFYFPSSSGKREDPLSWLDFFPNSCLGRKQLLSKFSDLLVKNSLNLTEKYWLVELEFDFEALLQYFSSIRRVIDPFWNVRFCQAELLSLTVQVEVGNANV